VDELQLGPHVQPGGSASGGGQLGTERDSQQVTLKSGGGGGSEQHTSIGSPPTKQVFIPRPGPHSPVGSGRHGVQPFGNPVPSPPSIGKVGSSAAWMAPYRYRATLAALLTGGA
jgi:hypothetical protein